MWYYIINYIALWSTCVLIISETKKPRSKRQQTVWRLECELGVIADIECPVDGGWTPWSPWSFCQGSCDDVGHRSRMRQCINPPPSQDGLPCSGPDTQSEPCFLTNCTSQDFRKIVKGDSARSEALQQLEAVPALMERCLQMECPFEAIEAALASDNTWQINPEALWNSLQCVKHNLGCSVIGEWGAWGAWSACGARCGHGLRWRLRRCDTPAPSNARLICKGTPLQEEDCAGDQCAISRRDSGGSWGDWGPWTICSEHCGPGIRRRKRNCFEINTPRLFGSWGTHCRGQHDQLQVCESKQCNLDGGWAGWGAWGPCSQSCGAGRRSRTRSCTRPIPAGQGNVCLGPRIEVGSCHLIPCEIHSQTVAVFNGESFLQYNFDKKRSTFFHFYVRFMPLSPHGTLVRRGTVHNPHVRLSLQKWHLCLDASGSSQSCSLPRICSHTVIEPAVWHSALITVTSLAASLRLNDAPIAIRSAFSCDPELPDDNINIIVGEKFHGEVQEIILNFIPLKMIIDRGQMAKCDFCLSSVSNVAYEKASIEEAYITFENEQFMRLPCFDEQEEWRLELTLKPKRESGTIVFIQNEHTQSWLYLALQNMRLKLKLAFDGFRSESSSSVEIPPDQWLDIALSKKQETNTIEAKINAGERLHVSYEGASARKRRENGRSLKSLIDSKSGAGEESHESTKIELCVDEYFVGGVPMELKKQVPEDFTAFSGIIASITVNNILLDLHSFSMESYKDDKILISSRTASISGSYHETYWGKSNRLNLTCLHARTARSPHAAKWLYLDTAVNAALKEKMLRSVDDGRVLRLVATADNDLRGFYTCRAHTSKRTRNLVTYGVLGKIQYKLTSPDVTTAFAVITTLTLVIGTIAWLIVEGIDDLRNGYGFFRDAHLSPEEEADAVCKYIDQNMHLVGSKSAAKVAKAKARRRCRQLSSQSSCTLPQLQNPKQFENRQLSDEDYFTSEPEGLPALPEAKSLSIEPSHDVFRCEQSYISSPRHGSITSPRTKLTSTSKLSLELPSPRVLCSRLLVAKHMYSPRGSLSSKKNRLFANYGVPRKNRSNLLTIKSSSYIKQSPAQKILQKFQELKSDDS